MNETIDTAIDRKLHNEITFSNGSYNSFISKFSFVRIYTRKLGEKERLCIMFDVAEESRTQSEVSVDENFM